MAEETQKQQQESSLNTNKYVIAAFLFLFSYGILYVIGSAKDSIYPLVSEIPYVNFFLPLPEFNSLLFILMPVAGFFFMFFLVDWINNFFQSNTGFSPIVPALFFGLSLLAFYIALFWYIGNYAQLQGGVLTIQDANVLFGTRFKHSGYYLFMLSGLFGWASRRILEEIKL